MTMGELAKRCGVKVATIRYYERRGLLPDPRRRGEGYRDYGDDDVRRLRFVRQAQGLGFTLKEIAELLALRVSPGTSCVDVRELAEAKLTDIEEKLRTLRVFKRALRGLVEQCAESGPSGACAILDQLEGEETASRSKGARR